MSDHDDGRAAPWPGLAPNPSTAQARVLLDELARCGVRHVVVCPGSRSTALAIAADEHPRLLAHVALDERGAGYLAVGVGRATGQPAAVVVTSGTAVANLLPAVVEADHDRVPLLLLTADRPPELHGVGANQTIEQHDIFGGSVRFVVDLGVADAGLGELVPVGGGDHDTPAEGPSGPAAAVARWRWTACRAHGAAVGRPVAVPQVVSLDGWLAPGPVQVDVPFREPTVPVGDDGRTRAAVFPAVLDGRPGGAPWGRSDAVPHVPPDHVLDELLASLRAEERGLVVLGAAVPGGPGRVVELAAVLGWPVLAEPHVAVTGDATAIPGGASDGGPGGAFRPGDGDGPVPGRGLGSGPTTGGDTVCGPDDGHDETSAGVPGNDAGTDAGIGPGDGDGAGAPARMLVEAADEVVLRHGTLLLGSATTAEQRTPSLVLRIGRTTVARETAALLGRVPAVVVVDAHGGWVDLEDGRVTLVRGAPAPTVAALLERLAAVGVDAAPAPADGPAPHGGQAAASGDDGAQAAASDDGAPDGGQAAASGHDGASVAGRARASDPAADATVDDEDDPAADRPHVAGGGPGWLASWRAADRCAGAVVARELDAVAGPTEPGVARAVLAALPPGGRLLVGSSMPIRDLDLVAGRRRDVVVHANRGASGIDGAVATAFGVRLGGAAPTVALVGDLTLLHDQTAWLLREDPAGTAADLVVVVVDNDGGGIFSFLPQRRHVPQFERLFGTPHGVDLAHLARLHGLVHHAPAGLVDDGAVGEVVTAALATGGRHLVHVRTERGSNHALHRHLRATVAEELREQPTVR